MQIYIHVCVRMCIYICLCVCVYLSWHTFVCVCVYTCLGILSEGAFDFMNSIQLHDLKLNGLLHDLTSCVWLVCDGTCVCVCERERERGREGGGCGGM